MSVFHAMGNAIMVLLPSLACSKAGSAGGWIYIPTTANYTYCCVILYSQENSTKKPTAHSQCQAISCPTGHSTTVGHSQDVKRRAKIKI